MSKIANNEIQAKTPEVGDVWLNLQGKKFYIYNNYENRLVRGFSTQSGRIESFCLLLEDFLDLYTYLGKSKVNIDDIFNTENEKGE